jgi:hypothetical protein
LKSKLESESKRIWKRENASNRSFWQLRNIRDVLKKKDKVKKSEWKKTLSVG